MIYCIIKKLKEFVIDLKKYRIWKLIISTTIDIYKNQSNKVSDWKIPQNLIIVMCPQFATKKAKSNKSPFWNSENPRWTIVDREAMVSSLLLFTNISLVLSMETGIDAPLTLSSNIVGHVVSEDINYPVVKPLFLLLSSAMSYSSLLTTSSPDLMDLVCGGSLSLVLMTSLSSVLLNTTIRISQVHTILILL